MPIEIERRQPKRGDKWRLGEVLIMIKGKKCYLWRAFDQRGNILDILMQSRRNNDVGKKFFRKLLKKQGFSLHVLVTDKPKRYGLAKKEMLPNIDHRGHKVLNNRAENSQQPTRQLERRMGRLKSLAPAQRFLSAFGPSAFNFRTRRHLFSVQKYRQVMSQRFEHRQDLIGINCAS